MKRRTFLQAVGASVAGMLHVGVASEKSSPVNTDSADVANHAIQEGDAVVFVSPGRVRRFTKADVRNNEHPMLHKINA